MLHGQHDLQQGGQASRFERVTQVGLDAAYGQLAALEVLGIELAQRLQLGGVSHLSAGRVGLDILNLGRIKVRPVSSPHGRQLALLARGPKVLATSIGGEADAANDGQNLVLITPGPIQGLEHQGHIAFRADQAIGLIVERARAAGTAGLGVGEQHQAIGFGIGGAAHDGQVDLARFQGHGAQGHGHKRGRAGRIHHQVGPVQAQLAGHQLGRPAGLQPRAAIGVTLRSPFSQAVHDLLHDGILTLAGQ